MKKHAILFVNWTDETFSHTWNGQVYTFESGDKIYLEAGIAEVMAKHLAMREFSKDKVNADKGISTKDRRIQQMMKKCIANGKDVSGADEAKLDTEMMNANAGLKEKTIKSEPTSDEKEKSQEEVFEGLEGEPEDNAPEPEGAEEAEKEAEEMKKQTA